MPPLRDLTGSVEAPWSRSGSSGQPFPRRSIPASEFARGEEDFQSWPPVVRTQPGKARGGLSACGWMPNNTLAICDVCGFPRLYGLGPPWVFHPRVPAKVT
jgi:hypothetical protein